MATSTKPDCTERSALLKRIAARRRQRGAAMVEGALVSATLVCCCLGILLVSRGLRAKLDAAYESRYLAFAGATHGCVDGATEPAPQMDPQGQPQPPDPDSERLK